MKKRLFFILLSFMLALLVGVACSNSTNTQSDSGSETLRYSIGSASAGGGFNTAATALSNVLNDKMPNLETVVEVTGASVDNVRLMQAGEIQLGLAATEVAWEAYHGKFTFEGEKHDKLRTLFPGWPGVYMFVTLKESEINSIHDLEGKKFSSGPKGSSNEVFSQRVFDTFDIQPDILNLPTSDAGNALKDGIIDGFAIAWPASVVTELETTHNVKIVTLTEEEREEFLKHNPPYLWLDIPAGEYKAVSDGVDNFGLYNLFIVSSEVPENLVYDIVKTAYENQEMIKHVWPNMLEGMRLENIDKTTIPYHPGAVKYLEEQGVEIPDELLPPESK